MASAAVFNPTRDRRRTNMPAQRSDDLSKGIWSSMLDSVATGKKLAEKNLVVLGNIPGPMTRVILKTDASRPM